MNILISNDDGINAPGIRILAEEVAKIANVYVVAPNTQRSANSHAITFFMPIMINDKEYIGEGITAYSTTGTPADCVKVGIESILKDKDIDLVLSGINDGPNLGTDVLYSGTVAAALEALVEDKPAMAFSCAFRPVEEHEYREIAKFAVELIKKMKDNLDELNDTILNVNFPKGENKGVRITTLGKRKYINVMEERQNLRGEKYVWMGGQADNIKQDETSDILAVEEGYISITPVCIKMTNLEKIDTFKNLGIEEMGSLEAQEVEEAEATEDAEA